MKSQLTGTGSRSIVKVFVLNGRHKPSRKVMNLHRAVCSLVKVAANKRTHWTFNDDVRLIITREKEFHMTRCTHWQWLCLVIAMTCPTVGAEEPAKKPPEFYVSGWMKLKLEYSQNILAGIAKADYDSIVKNAEGMQTLTTIEAFMRRKTPGYSVQVEQFKDATAELIKQAKKDNVEGAALAFTQMTLSCVNCHKRLREDAKPVPK